jgi:hypothetical protein
VASRKDDKLTAASVEDGSAAMINAVLTPSAYHVESTINSAPARAKDLISTLSVCPLL